MPSYTYYTLPTSGSINESHLITGWNIGVLNGYRSGDPPTEMHEWALLYEVAPISGTTYSSDDFFGAKIITNVEQDGGGGTQN